MPTKKIIVCSGCLILAVTIWLISLVGLSHFTLPTPSYQNFTVLLYGLMLIVTLVGLPQKTVRHSQLFLLLLGVTLVLIKPPLVDGLVLGIKSAATDSSFYIYPIGDEGTNLKLGVAASVTEDSPAGNPQLNDRDYEARFDLDYYLTKANTVALLLGDKPLAKVEITRIQVISYLLGYPFELKEIDLEEFRTHLSNDLQTYSRISAQPGRILVQTTDSSALNWLVVNNSKSLLKLEAYSLPLLLWKLAWILLLIAGYWLIRQAPEILKAIATLADSIASVRLPILENFRLKNDPDSPAQALSTSQLQTILLAWLLLLVLVLVRSWPELSVLTIPVEDDKLYFSKFYNFTFYNSALIYERPNAYYTVPTNLYAVIVSFLPVRWHPWAYTLIALLATSICCVIILFSGIFRNRLFLIMVPLVLGMTAIDHVFFWDTLTYQIYIWPLMVLLALFAFLNRSRVKPVVMLLAILLMVIGIWSGPYSVVILPVCILLFWVRPQNENRSIYLVLGLATFLYLLSFKSIGKLGQIFSEGDRYTAYLDAMVNKVFLLGHFEDTSSLAGIAVLLLLGFIFFLLRDRKTFRVIGTIFLLIPFLSMILYFFSAKFSNDLNPAYQLYAVFFWILFWLYVLHEIIDKYQISRLTQSAIALTMLVFVVVDNHSHPEKWASGFQAADVEFIEAIEYFENQNLARSNQVVNLINTKNWPGVEGGIVHVGSPRVNRVQLPKENFPDSPYFAYIRNREE